MAIYRPEQAQLTYGPEAAFGADSELARPALQTSTPFIGELTADHAAGSLELTVDGVTSNVGGMPQIGDFILIGTVASTYDQAVNNHEIRRIEWRNATGTVANDGSSATWTVGLDRPTGFFHANDAEVKAVTGVYTGTSHKKSKTIRNVPGVYETVDVPDLAPTLEPQYFLGTENRRSFQTVLKSQQSFDTSLTMTPLNGLPFRWAIGKVTTCAEDMSDTTYATTSAAVKKGDKIIPISNTGSSSAGVALLAGSFANSESTTGHYITIVDTNSAASNAAIESAVTSMGSNPESRRVVYARATTGQNGAGQIWLDQPLQFDHASGVRIYSHGVTTAEKTFRHVISETDELDSMSWHVHMLDSSETGSNSGADGVATTDSSFDRRYTGGKVGSSTISAEEGGLLQVSWDSINFRGLLHNNRNHASIGVGNSRYAESNASVDSNMPYFSLMQSITADDIDYPTSEPYYFSEGVLKFYGVVFARIRSFSLNVNNNLEPRYYVNRTFGPHRGPSEIREQRREYGLTATVVLPDVTDNMASDSIDSATALFRELLLEGNYGTESVSQVKGFTASLRFDRGSDDYFIIDIPNSQAATGEGKPLFANAGSPQTNHGNSATTDVGLFIRSAPHNLTTDAPMQIDLDMFFKNLVIYIKDKEPSYI